MNTIRYKIWQWGELTNQGSNVQYNVGIATKAKRSNVNPFALSNELICLRLGLALSLPVPLGVIILTKVYLILSRTFPWSITYRDHVMSQSAEYLIAQYLRNPIRREARNVGIIVILGRGASSTICGRDPRHGRG